MKRYLFYIEGLNREVWQAAENEREAQRIIWENLSSDDRNRVVIFDLIDTEDITG